MPVSDTNPEYLKNLYDWEMTRDASSGITGDTAKKYLEKRSGEYSDNLVKFNRRIKKAIYTNYTGRTRKGLIGAVYKVKPQIVLPEGMDALKKDADGSGQSLVQINKQTTRQLLEVGRQGLLAEYPSIEGQPTLEAQKVLGLKPSIKSYSAESIINWKTKVINGQQVLSLIVLKEKRAINADEFGHENEDQWRVLRLNDENVYSQQVYDIELRGGEQLFPRDAKGKLFDHIPFYFVGSNDNLPDIDEPALLDIARVNIGHFRNSADWESNLSIHSGATLVISTSQSNDEFSASNPDGVVIGENNGLIISQDGSADLLQLGQAQAIQSEMEHKETQMLQIGAKIISKGGQSETAEAARISATSENSMLDTMVGNQSEAYLSVLKDCALFMGENPEEIEFELNKDFWDEALNPQDIMAMIQLNDIGVMRKEAIVNRLQEAGWEDRELDVEDILSGAEGQSPLAGAIPVTNEQ